MTRSGAAAACLPACKYFEVMRFLHDKTSNLPTHSNVDISMLTCTPAIEAGTSEDQPDCLSPCTSSSSATEGSAAQGSSMSPLSIPGSLSISSPFTSEIPSVSNNAPKRFKRKATPDQRSDDQFLQQMQQMDDRMMKIVEKNQKSEDDESTVFCMSLIPVLRDFNKKKLRLAKIRIQQLLYDVEFGDD